MISLAQVISSAEILNISPRNCFCDLRTNNDVAVIFSSLSTMYKEDRN